MKALRQMGSGFIIGAISLILVIGGISLALAETSTLSPPPTSSPTSTTFAVEFASPLPTQNIPTVISTATPTIVINTSQAVVCNPPAGWIAITLGTNDTLYSIAERYKTTVENLNNSNCLNNTLPAAGSILYVPPVPTVTVIPCGPPSTWIKAYSVKSGDNLFRISLLYRTSVAQLQSANCMGSSTKINVGQVLWVPNVATSTPAVTNTKTNTVTPSSTATKTPDFSTPTSTFIVTSTPVPTTVTPSITPLPSTSP